MKIEKSTGVNRTEELVAMLCEKVFLKLWCYPNPYKDDGKEMCDVLAVFDNHVFVFFVREKRQFDKLDDLSTEEDWEIQWKRWKREVIDKQIRTANGVERYLISNRKIFLDKEQKNSLPIDIDCSKMVVHKIIVALGAKEACKRYSSIETAGSLAVSYGSPKTELPLFAICLERKNPVHVLDSYNLKIILSELDTVADLVGYLEKKVKAIHHYEFLYYSGEEDLLAHYFINYDKTQSYHIVIRHSDVGGLKIGQGMWASFYESEKYQARKNDNKISYLWDDIIQHACQNALDDTLIKGNIWRGWSAIHEMAKEPRLERRELSYAIDDARQRFPEDGRTELRRFLFPLDLVSKTGYVFLQTKRDNSVDYNTVYRPRRLDMLVTSCGVLRNQYEHLDKIVGIAMDAPKFSSSNSEDFVLIECAEWPNEKRKYFDNKDKKYNFSRSREFFQMQTHDFPDKPIQKTFQSVPLHKLGRNQPCPCGSGKKFKKCCLSHLSPH